MKILVDMDGVLADFEKHLKKIWLEKFPTINLFPEGRRTSFYIGAKLSSEQGLEVNRIIHSKGFFEALEPMEGAIEAMTDMSLMGHDVYIVTSAGVSYPHAAGEKYRWVEKHLGPRMVARLIITPSKYMVKGDVLIDDKPEIYNESSAEWEHILFDSSYNQNVEHKKRLSWVNWREIIDLPE